MVNVVPWPSTLSTVTRYLAKKLTFARAGPMTRNTRFAMSIPITLISHFMALASYGCMVVTTACTMLAHQSRSAEGWVGFMRTSRNRSCI